MAVLEGLRGGEEVVTSAQFLVDSESKLKEATAKMMETLNSENQSQQAPSMDQEPAKDAMSDHGRHNND